MKSALLDGVASAGGRESSTVRYGGNVRANGIRQHYLRYRPRRDVYSHYKPLVIIPGITSPAITWGFVAERLAQVFDTYVLDVRGRGLSESSPKLDYGLDTLAEDLLVFAESLGLRSWFAIGHSMGARIAVRAASRRVGGMQGIAMVDPPVSGPGRRGYPVKLSAYLDPLRECVDGIDQTRMRFWLPTWSDDHLRLRAEWLHTCDPRAVQTSFEGFHSDDIHKDLAALSLPLLLMTAERGGVVTEEDVNEIKRLAPQVRHVRVPNAGHMIPWDNEDGFYQSLVEFLGADVAARTD